MGGVIASCGPLLATDRPKLGLSDGNDPNSLPMTKSDCFHHIL